MIELSPRFPRLWWKTEVFFQVVGTAEDCQRRLRACAADESCEMTILFDEDEFYAYPRQTGMNCAMRATIVEDNGSCTIYGYVGLEVQALSTWAIAFMFAAMVILSMSVTDFVLYCGGLVWLSFGSLFIILARVWVRSIADLLSTRVYRILTAD